MLSIGTGFYEMNQPCKKNYNESLTAKQMIVKL